MDDLDVRCGTALRTARLDLRGPSHADVPALLRLLSDPRTTAHNPGDALADEEAARELVDRWARAVVGPRHRLLGAHLADRPEVLGMCGVRATTLHGRAVSNLLYRLGADSWGRGLATEAAVAVVQQGAARFPDRPVVARVRPPTTPAPGWRPRPDSSGHPSWTPTARTAGPPVRVGPVDTGVSALHTGYDTAGDLPER